MTAPVRPASVPTLAHDNWVFVPAIVSGSLIPKLSEITAGLDMTQYLIEPDCVLPTVAPQTAVANLRIGDTVQYEFQAPGKVTSAVLGFSCNPQATLGDSSNAVYALFAGGNVSGYLVNRRGLAIGVAFAIGQFVDVYPVTASNPQPYVAGTGASAESAMKVSLAYTAPMAEGVAITS